MKVSFNWLRELVEIGLPPAELADRLTMAGLEVEGVEEIRPAFTRLVVGRIQAIDPPPRGEKVSLCRVDVGTAVVPILSGAPNIAVGARVAVALPGAELPNGRQIQEVRIGGECSVGMLCSEKELGLGEDSTGLLVLDETATPGLDLAQALRLHDYILEVAVTANRGDCLSHWGMAREVAALTGGTLRLKAARPREGTSSIRDLTAVTVKAADLCPRYAARVIQGVRIGPSPFWVRWRLVVSGVRPVNNVVDATNYVLLEMGQPLHAFDHTRLEGGRIVVRQAVKGERIVTLDGQERTLEPGMLVIADAVSPVAIAGVMGGLATEVTGTTRDLLLESALFQPVSVRRTAKALGLSSESSYRFERGIDPQGVDRALDRVAALIVGLAGGRVARGRIDVQAARPKRMSLRVRVERVRQVLGSAVALPEVGRVLKRIQCRVKAQGSRVLAVIPPSHRLDLTREIDLIEEVARLRGFDQIPASRPMGKVPPAETSAFSGIERQMRRLLTAWGFQETVNFSFTGEGLLDKLRLPADDPRRSVLRIRNPLGGEAVLRSVLLPSLLENLVLNESRGSREEKFFEIARVFRPQAGAALPAEVRTVALVAAGDRLPAWWGTKGERVDFYDLRGIVEAIAKMVGVSLTFRAGADIPYLHPGQQAEVVLGGDAVGSIGALHPEVVRNFDLRTVPVVMEMDLDRLDRDRKPQGRYSPLPRYPAVFRDMAVVVPERMRAAEVEGAIRRAGGALVEAVRPFDVYRGEPVPEGKKSLAFSIQYRAVDRTLTDEEVATIHGKILEAVERDLGGVLR
jgi:phenylalanyl-tRNA synthetase beta chain